MTDSIKVGPGMRAFAMGVVAGDEALALARQESKNKSFEDLAGNYWFRLGFASASLVGTPDQLAAFMAGAATRAPSRTGFTCYFETDGAQFHSQDQDADDFDLDRDAADRTQGIKWVLKRVMVDVDSGAEDALVFDNDGNRIGVFSINED